MEKGQIPPHKAKEFAEQARQKGGNVILSQGKATQFYRPPKYRKVVQPAKRGTIKTFSPASRRRLQDYIARIDWSRMPKGAFITVTYPDERAKLTMKQTTDQRNLLVLKIERHFKEPLLHIWRKECVPRKSGRYKKYRVQHFHLCVFTTQWIPVAKLNEWWRECIKWPYEVQVHRKHMDGEHAAFYMAKYLTKDEEQSSILEDGSYLNSPGRMWGWRREEMIPYKPLDYWIGLSNEQYDAVIAETLCLCPKACEFALESFTVRGVPSDEARKIIRQMLY